MRPEFIDYYRDSRFATTREVTEPGEIVKNLVSNKDRLLEVAGINTTKSTLTNSDSIQTNNSASSISYSDSNLYDSESN